MKKSLRIIYILIFVAVLNSCGVSDSTGFEYAKWSFAGVVVDATTGQGLNQAEVHYVLSGNTKITRTDSLGRFYIDELPYGSAVFNFYHRKIQDQDTLHYAPRVVVTGSLNESSAMEGVVASNAMVIRLKPLNAALRVEFFLKLPETEITVPVNSATAWLTNSDSNFVNLFPTTFEGITDSTGVVHFKKLPAQTPLNLHLAPLNYQGQRYVWEALPLANLLSDKTIDLGRFYVKADTLVNDQNLLSASNVLDKDFIGLKNLSPLVTPYFVFKKALKAENLALTLSSAGGAVNVKPVLKGDTLYLQHTEPLAPHSDFKLDLVGYEKKSGERISLKLEGNAVFSTGAGLYAMESNAWPLSKQYSAMFAVGDTIWVKFSDSLDAVTRVQWHEASKADLNGVIYGAGSLQNADAWVKADTLFVKLGTNLADKIFHGDDIGFNITVFAKNGLYLSKFELYSEIIKLAVEP